MEALFAAVFNILVCPHCVRVCFFLCIFFTITMIFYCYYLIISFLEGHPYREQRGVSGQGPKSERWARAGKHRLHPGQPGQLHRNVSCWGEYSPFKVQQLSYDSGYKCWRTLMNCIKGLWFICDWNYFLLLTQIVLDMQRKQKDNYLLHSKYICAIKY